MTRIAKTVTRQPQLRTGIGGNLYVISSSKLELLYICQQMDIPHCRIYTSEMHECFALRFKRASYKKRVREIFKEQQ